MGLNYGTPARTSSVLLGNLHFASPLNAERQIGNQYWCAYKFTPPTDWIMWAYDILCYKSTPDPGNVTVSIRAVVANKPSGADLAVGVRAGAPMTDNIAGAYWLTTFSTPALLTGGTTYCSVIRCVHDWSAIHVIMGGGSDEQSSGDSGATWDTGFTGFKPRDNAYGLAVSSSTQRRYLNGYRSH
jgi:hypothetical protein